MVDRGKCVEPFAHGRGTSSSVSANEALTRTLAGVVAGLTAASVGLGGCSEDAGARAGAGGQLANAGHSGTSATSGRAGDTNAGTAAGGAPNGGRGGTSTASAGAAGRANAGSGGASTGGSAGTTSNGGTGPASAGAASRGGAGSGGGGRNQAGADHGGAPDEGGADNGGAPAHAGGCAARNLTLCEDFESTAVGSVPSGWTRHGDLAAVNDDDAHASSRSLKLGPASNSERRIYHSATALGGAHWGRIYYKVQTPVPDAFVHSTLVSLTGNGPKNGASDYRPIDTIKQAKDTPDVGGRHNFIYNVQIIGKSEFGTETSYDYVFDAKWHCAEYHIDAANQSYALYLDGQSILAFERGAGNYDKSDIPERFDEVRVGWINYQSAPPGFTAWIDDVAFDDARIGCD